MTSNLTASSSRPKVVRENILIPSVYDGTQLEARLSFIKREERQESLKAVVISHPYGPLGGNFNNHVIHDMEYFFLQHKYLTLAFNFRGAGKSKGHTSWSGEPESGDYKTMLEFLANGKRSDVKEVQKLALEIPPIKEVIIVGYSYGSLIATSLSSSISKYPFPVHFVLISYPFSVTWFLTFFRTSKYRVHLAELLNSSNSRVLFVYGDSDQFTGVNTYRKWIKGNEVLKREQWTVREIDDVDHFWISAGIEELNVVLDEWVNNRTGN